MKTFQRDAFRYTPLFCEENIWWLARDLVDQGQDARKLEVLMFGNRGDSVLLLNQRAGPAGRAVAWDYHVVLRGMIDGGDWIFDFDTRLPFPVPAADYLSRTFPAQAALPERYRCWVRTIPAQSYLAHLHSDRGHMIGRIPDSAFPGYPPIHPGPGVRAITLRAYRDMRSDPGDGSRVRPVEMLCAPLSADGPAGQSGPA